MRKNLLILSSFIALTACQSVPVKNVEIKKAELPIPKIIVDSDNDGVPDDIDQCPNTPLNTVVDERGCPIVTECEFPFAIEYRAFYEKNSNYPNAQYLTDLQKIVERIQAVPKSKITIEGHASKADTAPESISRERAVIIAQILKEKYGISENRITINSYGTERPISPNETKKSRAMNQRVYAIARE